MMLGCQQWSQHEQHDQFARPRATQSADRERVGKPSGERQYCRCYTLGYGKQTIISGLL